MSKIDISSLDAETKNKIEQYSERCQELDDLVERPIVLNCKIGVNWSGSLEPTIVDVVDESYIWDQIRKEEKKFLAEIKKETQEIVNFSNKIADQLGVNREEFWDYFTQYVSKEDVDEFEADEADWAMRLDQYELDEDDEDELDEDDEDELDEDDEDE